jgi:S-adenosylmethionine-diacylglycerol 3-amino-3-carboxypropyl transferase
MTARADSPSRIHRAWAAGRFLGAGGEPEVIFGQMREDVNMEIAALREGVRGVAEPVLFAVASGGCTAFSLLTEITPARLYAVDVNQAQLHLVRLKAAILQDQDADSALEAIANDARPAFAAVRDRLDAATREYWDARSDRLAHGLNRCGTIDRALSAAIRLFHALFQPRGVTDALLRAESLEEQAKIYRTRWNRGAVGSFLRLNLSRPLTAISLGAEYARLVPRDGVAILQQYLDELFLGHPARTNPYLWQVFADRYPPDPASLPPYLRPESLPRIARGLERVEFHHADAITFLASVPAGSVHFFALSNILDGMPPAMARRFLTAVGQAAAPSAVASLRFFVPPPIGWEEWLPESLRVDVDLSIQLERQDRSVVCRFIRILRRAEGAAA